MRYSLANTTNHSLALADGSILIDLNTLIKREGFLGTIPFFNKNEIVMDLDLAEEHISDAANRPALKSMDMAFGLSNDNATVAKMLLVELRLNYRNPNNLDRAELEGKVAGSSRLLSNIPPISRKDIFVFKTGQIQEAINRLRRMNPRIDSNYFAYDIESLKDEYF